MSVKFITILVLCVAYLALQLNRVAAQPPAEPTGAAFTQPAPTKELQSVEHPDVINLEEEVRRQITNSQKSLLNIARDNNAKVVTLGENYGELGRIYHLYSLFPAAEQCYENARRLQPGDLRWTYLAGKSLQQQGKFEEALKLFDEAAKIDPDYKALPVSTGDIYLELNRLDEAAAAYQSALKLDPKSAAAVYGLGQVELARRNYSIAAVYFEKVLELVPAANRVYYSLASAHRGQKEIEKANAALARQGPVGVRAADPLFDGLQDLQQGARLNLMRGKQAIEAGRFNEAAAEYQKAIAADPSNIAARVNFGAVLIRLGEGSEAIRQFQEAIRLDPKSSSARFNLAVLFAAQGKNAEAIEQYQAIVAYNPNDSEARFQLGKQLLKSGKDDDALAEFGLILEAKPDFEDALIERINILLKKKRYQEVGEALEKSYAEFPQHIRTTALLARFLAASPRYSLRDGKRALELAQKLFQAAGTVEHGVLVAMAYAELIDCVSAVRWQKAMISMALKAGDKSLAQSLQPALKHYQTKFPCRIV